MNDFKAPPDISTTTVANPRDSNSVTFSPWSSQGIVITVFYNLANNFSFMWHDFSFRIVFVEEKEQTK